MIPIIQNIFQQTGWTWKIDGKDTVPDADQIEDALDKLAQTLYAEPAGTQLSLGRLIVMRKDHPTLLDVYVMVGSIDKEKK